MTDTSNITIDCVRSAEDIAHVTGLIWAFFDYIKDRYPDRVELVDAYIENQQVAAQLADFATNFNPPAGECLLARLDNAPVGIVLLKPEAPGVCELNRMYVTREARGFGVARALCNRLIEEARGLGYTEMRLDAVDKTVEALPLYRSLGFEPDPNPPEFAKNDPDIVSLRRPL